MPRDAYSPRQVSEARPWSCLLCHVALVLTIAGGIFLDGMYIAEAQPESIERLSTTNLVVSPVIARVGEDIEVAASVVNIAREPIRNLRISTVVSSEEVLPSKSWRLVRESPTDITAVLEPGARLQYAGTITFSSPGTFRIGLLGMADNAKLAPNGILVRVILTSHGLWIDTLWLLTFYAILLMLNLMLLKLFGAPRSMKPHVGILTIGCVIIFVSITMLWIRNTTIAEHASNTLFFLGVLPLIALSVFMLGWIVIASGLRPQGRLFAGAVIGIATYVTLGLGWLVLFNAGILGKPVLATMGNLISDPGASLALALMWPLQLAQYFGLFNLSFG